MYIDKSGDYSFQRRSYSAHKGRRLFKQIMRLATDSFILHVLSPHLADDQIQTLTSRAIMRIKRWFSGDVLIVDRGFRDVTEKLIDTGIQT